MKQDELIKKHLEEHSSITSMEAIELYGCTRLSARIWNLRHKYKGLKIVGESTKSKNRYGRNVHFTTYRLVTNDGGN